MDSQPVKNDQDRLTLDCCVYTDRAKHLGYAVLEYKSTQSDATPPVISPAWGCGP